MGLKGDLEEIIGGWNKHHFWFKAVLILFFFLSVSAVANLADIIFKWKGFILEGLDFHKEFIALPLKDIARFIGLNYTMDFIYFLNIFLLLVYFPTARNYWNYGRKLKYRDVEFKTIIYHTLFFILLLVLGHFADDLGFGLYALIISIWFIFSFADIVLTEGSSYIKTFLPTIITISVVLILAAINSGLTR